MIDVLSTTGLQQVPPPYYELSKSNMNNQNVSKEELHTDDAIKEEAEHDNEKTRRELSSVGEDTSGYLQTYDAVEHHGELTYTLYASRLSPLADHSVLIAALIMIFVYFFILIEVIHRTLVAIFGSMVALFFFFLSKLIQVFRKLSI